jgi:hypothetical protein
MIQQEQKLNLLKRVFGDYTYRSSAKEAEFLCPFCMHRKRKLAINIESGMFHCWVCNKSGKNLFFLFRQFGSQHDVEEFSKVFNYKIHNKQIGEEQFKLKLPANYIPIVECVDSFVGKQALNYLIKKRGLSFEDVLFYKIGISNESKYGNMLVLPSFDKDGILNFYTLRSLNKGYTIPLVPKGYKNTVIMNELYIDWKLPVIITEGYFDAIKCGKNAIPLFGSSLQVQSKLFRDIVKNNSTVFLALDSDAKDKSMHIARKFMSYDVETYFIDMSPFKDAGEMSKDQFSVKFNDAVRFSENFIMREKIRELYA